MDKDKRFNILRSWLTTELNLDVISIEPASADASFRRYFRVQTNSEPFSESLPESFIVMDAPPEKESVDDFIRICSALIKQGVDAPKLHQIDQTKGLILLEDLGDDTLLDILNKQPEKADKLYSQAIESLIRLQNGYLDQTNFELPSYDETKLAQEMQLFDDWYLGTHRSIQLSSAQQNILTKTKALLIQACLEQPQVWVHRDYHSRNIMLKPNDNLGIIDFQDMVLGPISYDLASLLKDCYIEWPREQQLKWLHDYYQLIESHPSSINTAVKNKTPLSGTFSFDELVRWYDLTGLQRHLKVLGIFCRLNYRDNKPQYLNDLPLVQSYISEVCQHYSELTEFSSLFESL